MFLGLRLIYELFFGMEWDCMLAKGPGLRLTLLYPVPVFSDSERAVSCLFNLTITLRVPCEQNPLRTLLVGYPTI